jgi:F-type H+-transporting ATPase subunit alpha
LAQYRELAAFSQFASDLDEATKAQLQHGERVTELMKQGQYKPMSVAQMAISIYAANEGYLKSIEVSEVGQFEADLHAYMQEHHGDLMTTLNSTGEFGDDVQSTFKSALDAFIAARQ